MLAEAQKIDSLDDLKRDYFPPTAKDQAQIAIKKAKDIAEANNIPVNFNWQAEDGEPLPEGYGVAIIPIPQRREGGNVIVGLHVAGLPDPAKIAKEGSDEGGDGIGEKWIADALVKVLINKYSNAVRSRDGQTDAVTAPFSVRDFITSATRESGLVFFREIQALYVRTLKKKGLKLMNAALLKQTVASAQFAEQTFPNIPQTVWEGVLDTMIRRAVVEHKEPGIIKTWRETRNSVTFDTGDFNLDDLDNLFTSASASASVN